ncbi:site-specific integrase [Microbacterium sp. 1P10UB]|uniref:tyrosine-type recombinase/integrase n=1 Tax=unclassified Microbacterium TaxID=2609290 RepID=UPI0039A391F5
MVPAVGGRSLTVFRQPSRPNLSAEDLLAASTGRRPFTAEINGDWRPITQLFIDAMMQFPGASWQERWEASGAEHVPGTGQWHAIVPGLAAAAQRRYTGPGFPVSLLIKVDALRPSAAFLNRTGRIRLDRFSPWSLEGFDPEAPRDALRAVLIIQVATGKHLAEITVEDLLIFAELARNPLRRGAGQAWEIMKRTGFAPAEAPPLRQLGHKARPDAAGFVAQYRVEPPEVADMFTRYLRTRETVLDYGSLRMVANELLRNFWGRIRARNPEQNDLRIGAELGRWWKADALSARKNGHTTLWMVRALYLDIAELATDDASWARWVAPVFVTQKDTASSSKLRQRTVAAKHQRIRQLTPGIPRLMDSVDRDWDHHRRLLEAARTATPGDEFRLDGATYMREIKTRGSMHLTGIPITHQVTGQTVLQARAEERSFWAWAAVHILHETGVRLEELSELTATALFTLETTAREKMLMLQIVPSKSDRERVLLVSPELAHVLALIRQRIRGDNGLVPLAIRYDALEREFSSALPFLFQWRDADGTCRVFSHSAIRAFVDYAVDVSGIADDHGRLTPHDFRRVFATDALRTGLPVHILAKVMGHLNIATTQGYAAVFDEDVARHFREFVDRRRATRPVEDYREPDPEELEEFQAHFANRKVELGSCSRAYGTPCIHEHACIRCPMLRPDPAQRQRLESIRANLVERRGEATRMGWNGELEGIEISIRAADDKLSQMTRIVRLTLARRRP